MDVTVGEGAGPAAGLAPSPRSRGGAPEPDLPVPRLAVAIHVATLVAAFVVWLHLDRHLWFYGDEWDFLVHRGLFHAQRSIWAPHNEHWSTLPILLWRGIFSIVHLQHYWPYLVALLIVHLAVLHLLWRRGRREEIDVWVLSAFVALMAFLGSGAGDLAWAFQVGFLGSLAFGLLALDLLDRPAPPRVTDTGAVLAAAAALMCSNIGVPMLVALGVLALARRGWRGAAAIVALPAAGFVVWYVLIGHAGTASDAVTAGIVEGIPRFVWNQVHTNGGRIFRLGSLHAAFLAPVLIIALLAWLTWRWRQVVRPHAAVVALLAADLVFHIIVALARERLGRSFDPSRYVYIDAVLLLPAFALMVGRRRPAPTAPPLATNVPPGLRSGVAIVLLLAAAVGNLTRGVQFVHGRTHYVLSLKTEIIGTAELLAGDRRAISERPIIHSSLTPGSLRSLERRGLLPEPHLTYGDRITDETALNVTSRARPLVSGRFEVLRVSGATAVPAGPGCAALAPLPGARLPRIDLELSGGSRSAATEVSRTTHGKLTAFATPGHSAVRGTRGVVLAIAPDANVWLSDAVPHEHLLVRLPGGRTTFCDLDARRGGPAG